MAHYPNECKKFILHTHRETYTHDLLMHGHSERSTGHRPLVFINLY